MVTFYGKWRAKASLTLNLQRAEPKPEHGRIGDENRFDGVKR